MSHSGAALAGAAALAGGLLTGLPTVAGAGDTQLGAYLAGECTTCHRSGPAREGIPSIFGLSESSFVSAMQAYRSGERKAAVMRSVAAAFSDREIEALARYFATVGTQR